MWKHGYPRSRWVPNYKDISKWAKWFMKDVFDRIREEEGQGPNGRPIGDKLKSKKCSIAMAQFRTALWNGEQFRTRDKEWDQMSGLRNQLL